VYPFQARDAGQPQPAAMIVYLFAPCAGFPHRNMLD